MKIKDFFIKNKKYVLILIVGIILLSAGSFNFSHEEKELEYKSGQINEKQLIKTLEKIYGAGEVNVFISYKNNGTKQIAKEITKDGNSTEIKPESVQNDFYVLSVDTPEITGVLITASGASDKKVKERILRGAKHALGVPYHIITVEQGQ